MSSGPLVNITTNIRDSYLHLIPSNPHPHRALTPPPLGPNERLMGRDVLSDSRYIGSTFPAGSPFCPTQPGKKNMYFTKMEGPCALNALFSHLFSVAPMADRIYFRQWN